MEVIYSLIPGMIFFGLVFTLILFWAISKGQYDDLEGDGQRILMDDEKNPKTDQMLDNRCRPDAD
jgi:cbb3-type cytochrome oxidase maturation protein